MVGSSATVLYLVLSTELSGCCTQPASARSGRIKPQRMYLEKNIGGVWEEPIAVNRDFPPDVGKILNPGFAWKYLPPCPNRARRSFSVARRHARTRNRRSLFRRSCSRSQSRFTRTQPSLPACETSPNSTRPVALYWSLE